jgi:16S rRNA (guanine1516-N2)-methyltransferase
MTPVVVGYELETLQAAAECLAASLEVRLDNVALPRLSVTPDKLVLLIEGFLPLSADFNSAVLSRRRQSGKLQGLVRACQPTTGMRIVDATAGWGRDAALLASFGAHVIMIERHPIMAALLADALTRLPENTLRMLLKCQDAFDYLQTLQADEYPDVIYLDPMHPARQKSALVKKEMQALQQLIGPQDDVLALLNQACQIARKRVVVKWPQKIQPLLSPHHQIQGKTVRFDVYIQ